jgi:transcriptional regulator with XRE-family HTH domain
MSDIPVESATDREIMKIIGTRLRALRGGEQISLVAARSGLNKETVSRAEHGDNPTLLTIVRLLRASGRLGALDAFVPEPEISPMALVRKRARRGGDRG